MYGELDSRYAPLEAMTMALKKALEDDPDLPTMNISTLDANTDTVTTTEGKVPIYTARDEKVFVEYETPSIVIFEPTIIPMRDMTTNLVVYRDYDYENMTVKEYPEPQPSKIRFLVHVATRNPTNSSVLNGFLYQKSFNLCGLNIKISPDSEQYDRVTVYWHEPEEMESNDVSRIVEYPVDVRTRIEILSCRKRKLFRPAADLEVTVGDYTSTKYSANTVCAFNVDTSNTEVVASTYLDKFPRSGTCEFETDGDTFAFTSRSRNEFRGVTGIENFHHYGESINLVS